MQIRKVTHAETYCYTAIMGCLLWGVGSHLDRREAAGRTRLTWSITPYCTRSDVKVALDPNLSAVDDAWIDELIAQAQTYMDQEIGYPFQQDGTVGSPATRVYSGDGNDYLPIEDLVALSSTVSGAVIETVPNTYLSTGGIWISQLSTVVDITADVVPQPNNFVALGVPSRKLIRQSGFHFMQGVANYKVLGIFGQPLLSGQIYPGVPNDIMRMTTRLVVHYYKMRDTAYADMVQAQGGIREKYSKGVPIDVIEVINNYRHRRFVTR
jgi:hypothetical protein